MSYELRIDENVIGKETSPFVIDRLSASTFGLYLSCPLAFYYACIAKIQIPQENLHLLFGSAVHKSLEDMYNGSTDSQASFKNMFVKDALDPKSQKSFADYYPLGLEMVKNYMAFNAEFGEMYGLNSGRSELRFKKHLINPLTGQLTRIPITGVLDRLTNTRRIIEFKTAKDKWDANTTKFKVQSLFYNLWYYTEYGEIADETLYFVMLKKYKQTRRDEVIQVISYKPTLEDLAGAWEEVDLAIDKIEAGEFARPKSGHSFFCDCRKYEKLLGLNTH